MRNPFLDIEEGGIVMVELSVEDKSKGKRIITQFFRTMPAVQKSLMAVFERDGYEGVARIQGVLYPDNAPDINSVDTLRKGLSMILQHIYGMPVEDKEGYFQEILKCRTPAQVVRKEKETLIQYFYQDFSEVKQYLLDKLVEEQEYRFVNKLNRIFFTEGEEITDMRGFKNQIRNLKDAIAERIDSGTSQAALIEEFKQYQQELETETEQQSFLEPQIDDTSLSGDEIEKRQIILNTLNEPKYQDLRNLLLEKTLVDSQFATFQRYLDNILPPSSRLVTNDLHTFSEGVKKVKEFRDNLERELLA
ncbi:hypothetical protein U27_06758 [Candidatus Vecturithrix granuli]|uniref:Uncharacterized protein n=1 Tax=Vecturithrix granuli TaxID=1499967 RepID=A0A081C5B8_VECG1|nr:hypothetical protein U27_06758 [Candidatus Vecturithrix granuli]